MTAFALSLLAFIWLTIIMESTQGQLAQVWVATVVAVSAICMARPLFFEFTATVARHQESADTLPPPESLVGAILQCSYNVVGIFNHKQSFLHLFLTKNYLKNFIYKIQIGLGFLLLYFLDDLGIGYGWINYCLLASVFVSIPTVCLVRQ